MKFTAVVLMVCVLIGFTSGCASEPGATGGGGADGVFVRHTLEIDGQAYRYAVYRPGGLDRDAPARGLVFLHGKGECGTDGEKMLHVGLPPAIRANPERWPFVVLVPQKPTEDSEWEDHERAVLAMLDRVIEDENVHPTRVAITGLSQGGHGTISMVARHPARFRAAAPVCGYVQPRWSAGARVTGAGGSAEGGDAALIRAFATTPVWFFHGGKDDVVPPGESEGLHALLKGAETDSTLTVFPSDNHNSWDSAYGKAGLARWLVEKTD